MTTARGNLKIRLLESEVIENPRYGCMTWALNATDSDESLKLHFDILRRVLGFQRRADHTYLSYAKGLKNSVVNKHNAELV